MEHNTNPSSDNFIKEVNIFKAHQMNQYTKGIILTVLLVYEIISRILETYFNRPITGFIPSLLLMLIVALPLWKLLKWMDQKIEQTAYDITIVSETIGLTTDTPQVLRDVIISINLTDTQKKGLAITHWCNIIIHIIAIISIIIGVIFLISNLPPAPLVHKILFFALLFTTIIAVKIYHTIILGFIRFLIIYL